MASCNCLSHLVPNWAERDAHKADLAALKRQAEITYSEWKSLWSRQDRPNKFKFPIKIFMRHDARRIFSSKKRLLLAKEGQYNYKHDCRTLCNNLNALKNDLAVDESSADRSRSDGSKDSVGQQSPKKRSFMSRFRIITSFGSKHIAPIEGDETFSFPNKNEDDKSLILSELADLEDDFGPIIEDITISKDPMYTKPVTSTPRRAVIPKLKGKKDLEISQDAPTVLSQYLRPVVQEVTVVPNDNDNRYRPSTSRQLSPPRQTSGRAASIPGGSNALKDRVELNSVGTLVIARDIVTIKNGTRHKKRVHCIDDGLKPRDNIYRRSGHEDPLKFIQSVVEKVINVSHSDFGISVSAKMSGHLAKKVTFEHFDFWHLKRAPEELLSYFSGFSDKSINSLKNGRLYYFLTAVFQHEKNL